MLALELVLVLVVAGLVVGTQFRVIAMAPLAFAACICASLEAMTLGASGSRLALHIVEAAIFFEVAYAVGATLVHLRLPAFFLRRRV
ncbi:hypothetical protein [Pleomorphomonas sp. NRK KF1]|uniref:hypothetical protein n=1 Tax=Pleomorphomonas sp. NRK KF1 TaxID=2943000 RepID=UPI002042E000|nr:hypothetical protein [Pleomorphomonas sp. NRK KF1]MCM5555668.1 hypothetical protein [Pleomorphomonas sp. NRK KF1]